MQTAVAKVFVLRTMVWKTVLYIKGEKPIVSRFQNRQEY